MTDEKNDPERAARLLVHDMTQLSEGQFVRDTKASDHPATMALVNRFYDTMEGRRQCDHLAANWEQVRFWYEPVPELIACNRCVPHLEDELKSRANTTCVVCDGEGPLRTVTFSFSGNV